MHAMMTMFDRSTKWTTDSSICITGSRRLVVFIAVLLYTAVTTGRIGSTDAQTQDAEGCTLCVDGSAPNLDGTIGDTSCRTIANALQQTPSNTDLCTMTQLQGYIHCNCPTYPINSYCSMCSPTGSSDDDDNNMNEQYYYVPIPPSNRNKIIPNATTTTTTSSLSCGEAEFIQKVVASTNGTDESICAIVLPNSAADYCGCIGTQKKTCFLCHNKNQDESDQNSSTTTELQYMNRLLPPLYTTSCASFDRSLGSLSSDECSSSSSSSGVSATVMLDTIPVSVQEYCGCPTSGDDTTNTTVPVISCDLCNNSNEQDGGGMGGVRNPNATISIDIGVTISCSDLDTVTRYITNETYCTTLQMQHETICCRNTSAITLVPAVMNRTRSPALSPFMVPNTTTNVPNTTSNSITAGATTSTGSRSSSVWSPKRTMHTFVLLAVVASVLQSVL